MAEIWSEKGSISTAFADNKSLGRGKILMEYYRPIYVNVLETFDKMDNF